MPDNTMATSYIYDQMFSLCSAVAISDADIRIDITEHLVVLPITHQYDGRKSPLSMDNSRDSVFTL